MIRANFVKRENPVLVINLKTRWVQMGVKGDWSIWRLEQQSQRILWRMFREHHENSKRRKWFDWVIKIKSKEERTKKN
jgi:hypothetical protein